MQKSTSQSNPDIQRPKARITLEPAQSINMPYRVGKELLALNNNWAAPLLQALEKSYVVHPPAKITPPQITPNEFDHVDNNKNIDNRLEKDVIMQFLQRASINVESGQVFDLKPISNIELHIKTDSTTKNDTTTNDTDRKFLSIPPPLPSLSVTYLHIVLSPISVHGSAITLSNYEGCLFLLDKDKKTVTLASEAAYFTAVDNQPKFIQTNGADLYIEVQNLKPSLVLIIVLMHSKALNLDNFIEEITSKGPMKNDPSKPPIPFAYSYITLNQSYDNPSAYSFNFPWSLIRSSDDLKSLFATESTDSDSDSENDPEPISLIGKATIQKLPFEKLPRCRLTSEKIVIKKDVFNEDPDLNLPLLALSIPQRTFFPTSIISLSSFSFTFNNPPKGDFAQFRVYLSDKNTDPINPSSLQVFIPRENSDPGSPPLTTFYESVGMPITRNIIFPDIVRMKLDMPLSQASNIIVQFITYDKKGQSIYKLTAFPLFVENNIIDKTNLTFYTHHVKDLKGSPDYIIKCQKSKKSSVSLNIDIPQVFYPSPAFYSLANAYRFIDLKAEVQKKIRPEQILPQLIPVVSKLFSLMSKEVFAYFLELLTALRVRFGTKESKPQLKSWIFHNFDPSLSKERFFSSFIKSFNDMVNENNNYDDVIKNFEILCNILLTSYMIRQEKDDSIYVFLLQMFKNITKIICTKAKQGNLNEIIDINYMYGDLIFIFHSLTDQRIMDAVRFHINNILEISEEKPELLFLIWNFLMRFSETNEFPIYIATHFPVKPISRSIFSPFNPVSSLIFLSMHQTFKSNDKNSIDSCCRFIYLLFKPLELDDVEIKMRYRIAYAFFPALEIILKSYENFSLEQQMLLVPPILFLLGYSPQQLIRYHLVANTSNLQKCFINFLNLVIDSVRKSGSEKNETRGVLCTIYEELTKRILQLFNFNIRGMNDYLDEAIQALSKLMNSSYQVPSNYPLLYDTVSRVIHYYPCQKSLVMSILNIAISRHHIIRCFAASLVLLFFKSDYDVTKTITQSSVEVLDCLSQLVLQINVNDIEMCKLMMTTISDISKGVFKNDDFTQRLGERTTAANNIANIAEQMRSDSSQKPEENCKYRMKIADQYKAFPSMRSYWLQSIVDINLESKSYSSAFVTQLHICALIATVIMYKNKIDPSIESPEFKKQFNFLVCQPISFDNKFILSNRLFEFFPSAFEETKMDVSKISKDFKYLALDFTLKYLSESLEKAITYGINAKLYYSVRPLYSLQLRIMAELGQYKSMGKVCEETSELFHNLKANGTITHSNPLKFYVAYNKKINEKSIYTIEDTNFDSFIEDCAREEIEIEQVYEFEEGFISAYKLKNPKYDEFENQHCWSTFRNKPSLGFLRDKIKNANSPEVELIQYKTNNPLPFYVISSEVVDEQKVLITLANYVKIEMQKIELVIKEVAEQFERLFPCSNSPQIYGDYTIHYNDDIERIISTLQLIFPLKVGSQSENISPEKLIEPQPTDLDNSKITLYDLLKVLASKNGEAEANKLAQNLKNSIERLMSVFKTVIDNSAEKNYDVYDAAKEHFINFRNEFHLEEIGTFDAYEGPKDPLLERFDYELL